MDEGTGYGAAGVAVAGAVSERGMARRVRTPSGPASLRVAHPPVRWFEAVRAWDNFLQANGLADTTRHAYRRTLVCLWADLMIDPAALTEEILAEYLAGIKQKGQKVQMVLRSVKSHYTWGARRGLYEGNPAAELRYKSPKYPPAVALTEDEFRRVVIAAAMRRPYPRRCWGLVFTLETGGRIGSIAAVTPNDVGTKTGQLVYFNRAKANRPYAIPLSPLAAMAVRELLPGVNGTLLGVATNTIWSWMHQAAVDAGLPKRKQRAHILRDTAATNLLKRTKNPRLVQQFLNHADLSQLHRYTAVTDEEMRDGLSEPLAGE